MNILDSFVKKMLLKKFIKKIDEMGFENILE